MEMSYTLIEPDKKLEPAQKYRSFCSPIPHQKTRSIIKKQPEKKVA